MRKSESPTSCGMFDTCALQYDFKYNKKLPWPTSAAMEDGKRFHEAVYQTWNHGRTWKHDDQQMSNMLQALYKSTDIQALPAARRLPDHKGIIKDNEHTVEVPCGTGKIFCVLDQVLDDDSCQDIKTSKSAWTEDKVKENLQHLFYPYVAIKKGWVNWKEDEKGKYILFRYVVVTTAINPQVQVISIKVREQSIMEFERAFDLRLGKIALYTKMQDFPHTAGAHCRWCPYQKMCPAWQTPA